MARCVDPEEIPVGPDTIECSGVELHGRDGKRVEPTKPRRLTVTGPGS
jgi:hypothetical protein